MSEKKEFQDKQYAFAAHIRDPENAPAPDGIEDRRMAVYRELFFNNLRGLLGTFFPVLRKVMSDEKWRHIIREFMQVHRARTPYFLELPEEFLAFLQTEYRILDDDVPFLTELAHYEYADLALRVSTDENDMTGINPDGDLGRAVPVKSELAWAFAYRYPVHRIKDDFIPTEPSEQPSYLALHRRRDDKVHFLELNAVSAALLEAIDKNTAGRSGERLLRNLAEQIHYPDVDALIKHGIEALEEMRQLQILVGTRNGDVEINE